MRLETVAILTFPPDKIRKRAPRRCPVLAAAYAPRGSRICSCSSAGPSSNRLLALRIPDWTHPGTSFSSWICNNWWRTAGHYDRRMSGPSVLTSIIGGAIKPDSGRLIFARHRIAVQLRTGSLIIANTAQELHGNEEILAVPDKEWWRITLIGYLRPQLLQCGTRAVEEEKRQRFLEELKERRAR